MKRLTCGVIMLALYWISFAIVRIFDIMKDSDPWYTELGEGPFTIMLLIVVVFSIIFLAYKITDYVGGWIITFLFNLCICIVIVAMIMQGFGNLVTYLFSTEGTNDLSIYLEHKFACNIALITVWHMIAIPLVVCGAGSLVKDSFGYINIDPGRSAVNSYDYAENYEIADDSLKSN